MQMVDKNTPNFVMKALVCKSIMYDKKTVFPLFGASEEKKTRYI